MSDKDIGRALLNVGAPAGARDPRQLTQQVLGRQRRRVRLLAALSTLLWLLAAAGVFFVVYAVLWHLVPKHQKLMRDTALGNVPAERLVELQALHFQAVEICALVIAASFAALTLGALSTVALVLVSRRATLQQINTSLAEISEQLKHARPAPADASPDPPRTA
jgi:hypothetical protein